MSDGAPGHNANACLHCALTGIAGQWLLGGTDAETVVAALVGALAEVIATKSSADGRDAMVRMIAGRLPGLVAVAREAREQLWRSMASGAPPTTH